MKTAPLPDSFTSFSLLQVVMEVYGTVQLPPTLTNTDATTADHDIQGDAA